MDESSFVGLGKYIVKHNPAVLASFGLGSCVGVAIYDPITHIGGLAHIMLPAKIGFKSSSNPNKYADVAIRNMVRDIERSGANKVSLVAKIVGGAHMFPTLDSKVHSNIGINNIEAVKNELIELSIRVVAQDVGGSIGRTIYFDLKNGEIKVKTKEYTKVI